MYFELGQENFSKFQSQVRVSITFKYKYNQSSSAMTLSIKYQYGNDHYQWLVVVLYHSTINPQVELNCT